MWIKLTVLLCCFASACLASSSGSPSSLSSPANKKEESPRGKRNPPYLSHFYSPSNLNHHQLDRRISTGSQIPQLYHSSPFFPPRSHSPYHKGRPHSLPAPPYAVQMEPLVQYSQRDPLYDTNSLSLNTDGHTNDLFPDNNHLSENVYGHKIIERPVYLKEPEPIIEIIIKESNVSLPPLPAPPSPPPKKKEQVQVFYVKYKKNPNGHGKDAVIYDKPIEAISPPIADDHEEEALQENHHHHHHEELVTALPPPSTTLRTIIRPESETYHSPSGVKVTFGKEGFDYDKRSPKAEDLPPRIQFPQGRQLSSSFPPSFPRAVRPPPNFNNFPPSQSHSFRPEVQRQPQPYRPFNQAPQFRPASFQRPNPAPLQYSTLPKYLTESKPQFPPTRPAPAQFHQTGGNSQRQPVPYQPFESVRNQPPIQFRPQTHFNQQQLPLNHKPTNFQEFNQNYQYHHQDLVRQQQPEQPQRQLPSKQNYQQLFGQPNFNQQENPSQHTQNIVPPGGELIHSLPKFEQHISVLEPKIPIPQLHQPQTLALQQSTPTPNFAPHNPRLPQIPPQGQIKPEIHSHGQPTPIEYIHQPQVQIQQSFAQQHQPQNHLSQTDFNERLKQQLREANQLQESIRNSHNQEQFFNLQHNHDQSRNLIQPTTTSKNVYSTTTSRTTTSTATEEPERPSSTTKDPKILEAQLPDEVPEDLRAQLLSSGILNNADISILDYDKVGDIPISALPPDQLANFYGAGGAQQLAASEPIPAVVKTDGSAVDLEPAASETQEIREKTDVQMKVVHYDPGTRRGQQVQEAYVKSDATRVEPVVLNDGKYSRYLPLKLSGTQFPIPDVAELRGKEITSVVVLAPISYDFSGGEQRPKRATADVGLIMGDALKALLKSATKNNFERFLESENETRSDQQAVILLVTGPSVDRLEKEIFMYDVSTRGVHKLDGELSAAFVEAAEANAFDDQDGKPSTLVETRVPYPGSLGDSIVNAQGDLETEASEHLESFVDISRMPTEEDLTVNGGEDGKFSKTGSTLPLA